MPWLRPPSCWCSANSREGFLSLKCLQVSQISFPNPYPSQSGGETDPVPAGGGSCAYKWCLVRDSGLHLGSDVVLQSPFGFFEGQLTPSAPQPRAPEEGGLGQDAPRQAEPSAGPVHSGLSPRVPKAPHGRFGEEQRQEEGLGEGLC